MIEELSESERSSFNNEKKQIQDEIDYVGLLSKEDKK